MSARPGDGFYKPFHNMIPVEAICNRPGKLPRRNPAAEATPRSRTASDCPDKALNMPEFYGDNRRLRPLQGGPRRSGPAAARRSSCLLSSAGPEVRKSGQGASRQSNAEHLDPGRADLLQNMPVLFRFHGKKRLDPMQ